jgi:outer membrane protein
VKINGQLTAALLFLLWGLTSRAQLRFSSPDSLFAYAGRQSVVFKVSDQQKLLAKWTRIAALTNAVNLRSPVSFAATDNIQLPVNFIPGDFFPGGTPGSFREITLGQRYVSNFSFNPQIDIINPANLAKIKSARISESLTEVNSLAAEKSLRESISAAFYNAAIFTRQAELTGRMIRVADSLRMLVAAKVEAGLAREQDLNNAEASLILAQDRQVQLNTAKEQQLNAIKILCDMPASTAIEIDPASSSNGKSVKLSTKGTLPLRQQELQEQLASAELSAGRSAMLPVVSLVYYQSWQQFSNTGFFKAEDPWIPSKYIGLRITVPFPPEVTRLSQSYNNKIQHRITALNTMHGKLSSELGDRSLELEHEKNVSAAEAAARVLALKEENFSKSMSQYEAGILSTDLLLQAYNDLLGSSLQAAQAAGLAEHSRNRIIINNKYQ